MLLNAFLCFTGLLLKACCAKDVTHFIVFGSEGSGQLLYHTVILGTVQALYNTHTHRRWPWRQIWGHLLDYLSCFDSSLRRNVLKSQQAQIVLEVVLAVCIFSGYLWVSSRAHKSKICVNLERSVTRGGDQQVRGHISQFLGLVVPT